MTRTTYNVLMLCTGNSARSIIGEAIFNHLGDGRVRAFSAGSKPAGTVNPAALEILASHGIHITDARSKSWDEFSSPEAPAFDFIFTVCGDAANEPCPIWPGQPATAHWGLPDPARVEPVEARRKAFEGIYLQLERRIRAFLELPLESMGKNEIMQSARRIHKGER